MRYDRPMSLAPQDAPPSGVSGHGLVLASRGSRALTAAFSRYLLLCHETFLKLPSRLAPSLAAATEPVVAHMRSLAARDPRNALLLYAPPTIGTPLQCAGLRDSLPHLADRIDAAVVTVTPHVLLEVCVRGHIARGQSFAWPAAPTLASPGLGIAVHAPEGSASLRFELGRVLALRGDGTVAGTLTVADGAAQGFRVSGPYTRVRDVTR